MVLLAIGIAFLPPAIMVALEALAIRFAKRTAAPLHAALLGALWSVLAAYVIKQQTELSSEVAVPLALAAGAGLTFATARFEPVRLVLVVLAPASLLFVCLFLFGSPSRHLVFPDDGANLSGPRPDAPIVMIVFDEFPTLSLLDARGELDTRSYPGFAGLARDGIWFRNATTVADFTHAAVPSILTGRHQDGSRPASISAHPDNLLALFGQRGGVAAHEVIHTRLCPATACASNRPVSFPRRVTRTLPALAKLAVANFLPDALYRRLPATNPLPPLGSPEDAFRRVGSLHPTRAPALHYEHVFLPHHPWMRLPSGRFYPTPGPFGIAGRPKDFLPELPDVPLNVGLPSFPEVRWTRDPYRMTYLLQRHLSQARYADGLLRRALDAMRASGLYDRALVVVTSDHGVSFEPGGDARRLSRRSAPEIVPVPLFIKPPNSRSGTVSDRFVQSIDVAPTVADILGMRLPWRIDGRTAVDPRAPDRDRLEVNAIQTDERFEFDARALSRSVRAKAAARGRLFRGQDPDRIFRPPPHSELIGRAVSELPKTGPTGLRAALSGHGETIVADPTASTVPAQVGGDLSGPRPAGRAVAVALNGRVAATARSHPYEPGVRFEALFPEELLRRGPNQVQLYAIVSTPSGTRLARIPVAPP